MSTRRTVQLQTKCAINCVCITLCTCIPARCIGAWSCTVHCSSTHMCIGLHTRIAVRCACASSCNASVHLDAHVYRAAMHHATPCTDTSSWNARAQRDAHAINFTFRLQLHRPSRAHVSHSLPSPVLQTTGGATVVARPYALIEPWTTSHHPVLVLRPGCKQDRTPMDRG